MTFHPASDKNYIFRLLFFFFLYKILIAIYFKTMVIKLFNELLGNLTMKHEPQDATLEGSINCPL